jgi:hypothetical protein
MERTAGEEDVTKQTFPGKPTDELKPNRKQKVY